MNTKAKIAAGVGGVIVLAGVGTAIGAGNDSGDTSNSGLAAAETHETSTPTPTTRTTIPKPSETTTGNDSATDAAFVAVARANGITGSTETIIELGHTACRVMDQMGDGPTAGIALLATPDWIWSPEKTGALLGASAAAYCPWHENDFDGDGVQWS